MVYLSMDVIKYNTQWWWVDILYGFVSLLSNITALHKRYENNTLTLKEEAYSSYINQAYNKLVANSDKAVQHIFLAWHQNSKQNNNALCDQCYLVHFGFFWSLPHFQPSIDMDQFIHCSEYPPQSSSPLQRVVQ